MKILRKSIITFLVAAGFLSILSCATKNDAGAKSTTSIQEAPASSAVKNTQTKDYVPDETNVKFLGRSFCDGSILHMSYSSTGAEFNINAKRLDVTIQGDTTARGSDNGNCARVVVFVNGQPMVDQMILHQLETFTVFDREEPMEGVVQIIKVSESTSSSAGIRKITTDVDGTISPSAKKELKIEFIGDSITCGYGVDDLVKEHGFKTATEDSTKTYAFKTAKNLDADFSFVSVSGWGIYSGYSGNGTRNSNGLLSTVYDRMGAGWTSVSGVNLKNAKWDFSLFQPDFVVINLGTNDASYTKGNADKIASFKEAYVEFIKLVRGKNPDAYIICSLGIMGQDLYPAIETAVNEYTAQTGDSKVSALKFDNQSFADGIAADWHPSEKTHAKAAAKLTAKIKAINQ